MVRGGDYSILLDSQNSAMRQFLNMAFNECPFVIQFGSHSMGK